MNENLQELYTQYWNCENRRPLFTARIPDGPAPNLVHDRAWWMSADAQLTKNEWELEHVLHIGDAYPLMCPNLGPDLFAACMGLELEFGQDTSWAVHDPDLCDPENYRAPVIDSGNIYYRKICELTAAFCEHSRGRYFVGITDLHPGLDGLVAFRSPQQLCFDTIEEPDFIRTAAMDLFARFRRLYGELCGITENCQKGTSNWMGVWYPGRQYVTSCDFGALISADMFRDLAGAELRAELDYLDASIFHLDGPGALKNLDFILSQKKLRGGTVGVRRRPAHRRPLAGCAAPHPGRRQGHPHRGISRGRSGAGKGAPPPGFADESGRRYPCPGAGAVRAGAGPRLIAPTARPDDRNS